MRKIIWHVWRYRGLVQFYRSRSLPRLLITRLEHVPGWGIYTPLGYATLERLPYVETIVFGPLVRKCSTLETTQAERGVSTDY